MVLEKVTALVVRDGKDGPQLLVFHHPTAGYQLPAGTVESGETPEEAVVREVAEETGLSALVVHRLGQEELPTPSGKAVLRFRWISLFREPQAGSARAGAPMPRVEVQVGEREGGFVFIHYEERDLNQTPAPLLWEASGWVPETQLAYATRRTFFQVEIAAESRDTWEQADESGHIFRCFWAPLDRIPHLIGPQQAWLAWMDKISGLH